MYFWGSEVLVNQHKAENMVEGWVMVYRSAHEYQTSLVKDVLEQNGLHPVVLDRKDDEFMIGEVELYVAPEEEADARKVISDNVSDEEE
jgi:hypothetical protein